MTHEELIAALEGASGPSRELDAEIWREAGAMPGGLEDIGCYQDPAVGCVGGEVYAAPAYTASVDAALTLLPEGWRIAEMKDALDQCTIRLWCPNNPGLGNRYPGNGRTPALALCISALKARGEG